MLTKLICFWTAVEEEEETKNYLTFEFPFLCSIWVQISSTTGKMLPPPLLTIFLKPFPTPRPFHPNFTSLTHYPQYSIIAHISFISHECCGSYLWNHPKPLCTVESEMHDGRTDPAKSINPLNCAVGGGAIVPGHWTSKTCSYLKCRSIVRRVHITN